MPSNAYTQHLLALLADAHALNGAYRNLQDNGLDSATGSAALNRAVVIACVSAWEAYVEELVRESLNALRPPNPPLSVWPALNAAVRGQLGRFNNPNFDNVRLLISDVVGLPDVHHAWHWQNCTSAQAIARLAAVMEYRHQIAHGINPRPAVTHVYADRLLRFFTLLGICTDRAVRAHLIAVHGIPNPWPE